MGGGRTAILSDFKELVTYYGGRRTRHKSTQDKGHASELETIVESLNRGAEMPIPFDELVEVTRATLQIAEAVARVSS